MSTESPPNISFSNTPPFPLERNEYGLLERVDYIFKENGSVDWRKMISPEFIVINKEYKGKVEELLGKNIADIKVEEVEDRYLLILLGGIKELARLRGYHSVSFEIPTAVDTFVAAVCEIEWIENYETEGKSILFQDGADANPSNTVGFGKNFLTTIAINRAFVRCVRNFLGINILGSDEVAGAIAPAVEEPQAKTPVEVHTLLEIKMKEKNISFEKLKEVCSKENKDAAEWQTVADIPKIIVFSLIERMNKKKGGS